jgi:hypothetical protein
MGTFPAANRWACLLGGSWQVAHFRALLDYVPLMFFTPRRHVDNRRRATPYRLDGAAPRLKVVPRDATGAKRGRAKENRSGHRRGNRIAELARRARAAERGAWRKHAKVSSE